MATEKWERRLPAANNRPSRSKTPLRINDFPKGAREPPSDKPKDKASGPQEAEAKCTKPKQFHTGPGRIQTDPGRAYSISRRMRAPAAGRRGARRPRPAPPRPRAARRRRGVRWPRRRLRWITCAAPKRETKIKHVSFRVLSADFRSNLAPRPAPTGPA